MKICTKKFDINFSDVGENNSLTNKGILRMMQEIAGIHSQIAGYGLNNIPKTGLAWLLLNWKLRVFLRPKWEETLTINTWSRSQNALFSYRDLEVYDSNNNLVAIATSKWLLFDVNKQTISKTTSEMRDKFESTDKSVFEEKFTEKLKEPENSNFVLEYTIQRRDIDTNHHVNNLNYLDFAYEALPEDVYKNGEFNNVEIMYKHEAKLGDTLMIYYAHTEQDEHIITIKDKETGILHTIIKLYK